MRAIAENRNLRDGEQIKILEFGVHGKAGSGSARVVVHVVGHNGEDLHVLLPPGLARDCAAELIRTSLFADSGDEGDLREHVVN